MPRLKNRAYQQVCLLFSLSLAALSSCERAAPEPSFMVASSLSNALSQWAQEREQRAEPSLSWQGAGSQRITQWMKGGARPTVAILAARSQVESLREAGLVSWELELGCTALALVRRSPRVTPQERGALSEEVWRDWGLGLSRDARLAIAAEEVPLGHYSEQLLSRSVAKFGPMWGERARGALRSRPLSAGATLALLRAGEVDAALLYMSSRSAAQRREYDWRACPRSLSPQPRYIAVGSQAEGRALAERLRRWILARPELGMSVCNEAGAGER